MISSKIRRKLFEFFGHATLMLSACIAIFITIAVISTVIFESYRFFSIIPLSNFLFGTNWSPQTEEIDSFGAVPLFAGTFLITIIALMIALPLGLLSSIYISEYASKYYKSIAKTMLELLAGIPTVVYGYFAALTVGPQIRLFVAKYGLNIPTENALSAGIVMGIMIIPFVMSLINDALSSIPQSLKDASYALGATKGETIRKIILPAATPGIIAAFLLAFSRAIGETMIVTMAAGLGAKLSFNPFDSVTTVTAQIVSLLVGDEEFNSPKALAAYALGGTLFFITLFININALMIIKFFDKKME